MTTKCSQYKKVTVITDPENPEMDLIQRAADHGKIIFKADCEDGFVYLILINDQDSE